MGHRILAIYEAYNEKGELVAQGTNAEIGNALDCNKDWICTYAKNKTRVKGKFRIKKIGEERRKLDVQYDRIIPKEKRPIPKSISPEEEIFNSQLFNLKVNGNTIVSNNPEKYLKIFKEHGFKCTYETIKRKKEKPYYIFSVSEVLT